MAVPSKARITQTWSPGGIEVISMRSLLSAPKYTTDVSSSFYQKKTPCKIKFPVDHHGSTPGLAI